MGGVPTPDVVAAVAAGRHLEPVWANELGGLTWRMPEADVYVKWAPTGSGLDLTIEAERMGWAGRFTPVPSVLDAGRDGKGSWLVTGAVDASSAVSPRWLSDPRTAVAAVGIGLRTLHDALPVGTCPWSWSVESRLATVERRVAMRCDAERPVPPSWETQRALAALGASPDIDKLVVCHGDPCCPNTLIDSDGRFAAHVDLASLGVADRWADLAVATYSTEWNYGPGWEDTLLESYGIDPDPERTGFYRRLWDLT